MKIDLLLTGRITAALFLMNWVAPAQTRYITVDLGPVAGPSAIANSAGGGQQAGYTFTNINATPIHAVLWTGSASSMVDLHPPSAPAGTTSAAYGVSGGQQVGYVGSHAALWSGTASSFVDLQPAGYVNSTAMGIGGGQQLGVGGYPSPNTPTGYVNHALLWSGSAASVIDLHPGGGFTSSYAYAAEAGKQVGSASNNNGQEHALIWSGSARSFVDLHSSKYISTTARAISGNQQVGTGNVMGSASHGFVTSSEHALLWYGSAASVVDLHPAGFTDSYGTGVRAGRQVGFGTTLNGNVRTNHALAWSGSAASVIDLNQFLPAGFTDAQAYGIDELGNIAGFASNDVANNSWHAVIWTPVQ